MKIIGSLLIVCASFFSCFVYEKREKKKITSALEICDFIKYIKSQIEFFSLPIDKIFSSYESKDGVINDIISKNTDELSKALTKEDYITVLHFFDSLGKGLKNEELSLCEYSLEKLQQSIDKKQRDYPNKIKVFRAMSLFSGFSIIIILL